MSLRDQIPLVQEMHAEQMALSEAKKDEPGASGAFHRLVLKTHPYDVVDWMHDEIQRKTDFQDVIRVLAQVYATSVFQVAVSHTNPVMIAAVFATEFHDTLREYLTGARGMRLVIHDTGSKKTFEGTSEGLLKARREGKDPV